MKTRKRLVVVTTTVLFVVLMINALSFANMFKYRADFTFTEFIISQFTKPEYKEPTEKEITSKMKKLRNGQSNTDIVKKYNIEIGKYKGEIKYAIDSEHYHYYLNFKKSTSNSDKIKIITDGCLYDEAYKKLNNKNIRNSKLQLPNDFFSTEFNEQETMILVFAFISIPGAILSLILAVYSWKKYIREFLADKYETLY